MTMVMVDDRDRDGLYGYSMVQFMRKGLPFEAAMGLQSFEQL